MSASDLFGLNTHFLILGMPSMGSAITTVSDMQRHIVAEHHRLTDAQFTASIAIAQSAPGPNVRFDAVLGWNVVGPLGALATMTGMLIPSTVLLLWATRWDTQRRETRFVRALTASLTPLMLDRLLATGWVLAEL